MIFQIPDRQIPLAVFFMFGGGIVVRFLFVLLFLPMVAHGATCDAGYYLVAGDCTPCPGNAYCPGDDVAYSCADLWTPQTGVRIVAMNSDKKSADSCVCEFHVETPQAVSTTNEIWRGKCATGPTEFFYVYENSCRHGYYATGSAGSSFAECIQCTNAPENTEYTSYGGADKNDCAWRCLDDWGINLDGTGCDRLCTQGFTSINVANGVMAPLYNERRTTPAVNVGAVGGVCYADLAPGRATGAINIMYNDEIFHTVSSTTILKCDAGYYLNSDGVCDVCGGGYYCVGDNTRIECKTLVPAEDKNITLTMNTWGHEHNSTPESCSCAWWPSDERRTKYELLGPCYLGTNNPSIEVYVKYEWCRAGYYAIEPKMRSDWYSDCAPCYNGPENSRYTSYSTPSVMYAVESNCPWECNDGYRLSDDGAACVVVQ